MNATTGNAVNAEACALRAAGEALHAAVGRLADDERTDERVHGVARRAWHAYCSALDRSKDAG